MAALAMATSFKVGRTMLIRPKPAQSCVQIMNHDAAEFSFSK
jgi:hypothetical protein